MLILTRKIGETITIGDNIRIKVLNLSGGQVKLGAEAPRDVSVHREEIYQRIQSESAQRSKQAVDKEVEDAKD